MAKVDTLRIFILEILVTDYVLIVANNTNGVGAPVTMTDSEYLEIAPNVEVYGPTNGNGISYQATSAGADTESSVDVEGDAAGSANGLFANFHTGSFYILVGQRGSITGLSDGIFVGATAASTIGIANSGTISGGTDGISAASDNMQISNSGVISGATAIEENKNYNAIVNEASGVIHGQIAIKSHGSYLSVENDGSISSTGSTDVINAVGSHAAISSSGKISGVTKALDFGAGADTVSNSGTIAVTGAFAIYVAGGGLNLTNSGLISAASHTIALTSAGPASSIVNAIGGVIRASGADDAINDTLGVVQIVNGGEIDGAILLGAGSSVSNSGKVAGQLQFLGSGGDRVQNSGLITVVGAKAVSAAGDNVVVVNSGQISAHSDDVVIAGTGSGYETIVNDVSGIIEADNPYYAIYVTGSPAHILNHGEIDGSIFASGASTFTNIGSYSGEAVMSGGGIVVRNSGHMSHESSGAVGDTGLFIGGGAGDDLFVNLASGVIDASNADSLYFAGGAALQAYNYGEMFGALALNGQTNLVNTGEITGDVSFNTAAGLFVNRGLEVGNVHFTGTGNIYRGQIRRRDGYDLWRGRRRALLGGSKDDAFDLTASGAAYVSGGAGDDSFTFTAAGLTAGTMIAGGDGLDTLTFRRAASSPPAPSPM